MVIARKGAQDITTASTTSTRNLKSSGKDTEENVSFSRREGFYLSLVTKRSNMAICSVQSTRSHTATEKLGSERKGKQLQSWASQAMSKQGMVATTGDSAGGHHRKLQNSSNLGHARNQGEQAREWSARAELHSSILQRKEPQKINRDRAVASVGASQADIVMIKGAL